MKHSSKWCAATCFSLSLSLSLTHPFVYCTDMRSHSKAWCRQWRNVSNDCANSNSQSSSVPQASVLKSCNTTPKLKQQQPKLIIKVILCPNKSCMVTNCHFDLFQDVSLVCHVSSCHTANHFSQMSHTSQTLLTLTYSHYPIPYPTTHTTTTTTHCLIFFCLWKHI